ncbi:MAG: hypothetical protein JWO51_234 [Rhodospirillales bacterium]|nr:hypothetical protein [Rhodospirillales bacterium]
MEIDGAEQFHCRGSRQNADHLESTRLGHSAEIPNFSKADITGHRSADYSDSSAVGLEPRFRHLPIVYTAATHARDPLKFLGRYGHRDKVAEIVSHGGTVADWDSWGMAGMENDS